MKLKQYLLLSLLLTIGMIGVAQEAESEKDNKSDKSKGILNHLSVTPQIGFLHYWGDLSNKNRFESLTDSEENKLGYGGLINYSISDVLSISGGVLVGSLQGTDLTIDTKNASSNTADYGMGILHKTDLFEITFPRIDLNLTRLIFRDKVQFFRKFSVNVFASHGLVSFDSKVYALNDENVNLKYYPGRGRTGATNEAVSTFGSSLSYIVNDHFDIGLESSVRVVYNDKLDAWPSDGSANDMYSFSALSVTYHLKPREYVMKDFELEKEVINEESQAKEEKKTEKVEPEEEAEKVPEEKEQILEKSEEVADEIIEEEQEDTPVFEEKKIEKAEVKVSKEEPKVEEKKEVTPKKKEVKEKIEPLKLYEGDGNFISVAAFRGMDRAQKKAQSLIDAGENPIITENRTGSWYIVSIGKYDDKQVAIEKMREARENGYERAWVLLKPVN
jgi:hypothetical protein